MSRIRTRLASSAAALTLAASALGILTAPAAHAATLGDSIAATATGQLDSPACGNGGSGYYAPGSNQTSSCSGGSRTHAWCADFAGWVWAQNGVKNLGILNDLANSFQTYAEKYDGGLSGTPHVGDAVFFHPVSFFGTDYDHVAIVTAVNSNGTISWTGGNQGGYPGKVSTNTASGAVGTVVWQSGGYNVSIRGYASPVGGTTPPAPAPVIKSSAVGVFRDGTWALRNASGGMTTAGFGQAGDIPITGDWDGYGHDQLGVFRPSTNTFALRHDDGSSNSLEFGNPGDIPVPGMWDHNGHAQMAVYRPSTNTFTVRHDNGSTDSVTLGNPGDIPIVGDWDGVGHTQMGVFRPAATDSDQNTFALRHDDGSVTTASYGNKGDL
ncbi:CHAP domain-containing protein, partial [Streptomyces katrae]|uniref:CHAP domain-containing protein n=1 Tax=Streptomyces katrae TaxID=68223 RepID=UPI0012FF017B